jgi:hypothetical protein
MAPAPNLRSTLALTVFALGIAALGAALAIPWAFVAGTAIGYGWFGPAGVVPSALLAAAAASAVMANPPRRSRTGAVTVIGALAAYMTVSTARAVPTMGAVWADADATPGPGLVALLACQALMVIAAWMVWRKASPGP